MSSVKFLEMSPRSDLAFSRNSTFPVHGLKNLLAFADIGLACPIILIRPMNGKQHKTFIRKNTYRKPLNKKIKKIYFIES